MHSTLLTDTPPHTLTQHNRYVVVDEAHMYTGVFGSHVALVLRRLLRLCLRYARGQQQQRASPSSQGSVECV